MRELNALLIGLRSQLETNGEIPADEIPGVLGLLRTIEITLLAKQLRARSPAPAIQEETPTDRWLTAEEVACRLRRTKGWGYRQARRLPFAKRPSRKTLLISESGLVRWMDHR